MKFLSRERLSQHKYKTPEGYLICVDSVLARTGKQTYRRDEVFHDSDDTEIEVDRKPEEVFSEQTLASFENKPITVEHPDCDVTCENYKDYAVGFVRDVKRGTVDGQDVILGTLVIQDAKTIDEIEAGEHVELSCGYDCDIKDEENPQQRNIRGNHVALCEQGRAGNARIVDTADDMYGLVKEPTTRYFLAKFFNEKWETDDNVAVIKAKNETEAENKLKRSGIKYDSIRELTHSEYIKFARLTKVIDSAVADMALSRADAMERCISLGKRFIEHFDKIYKNPNDSSVQHWKGEMKGWLDSVKEIKLKNTNKPLLNTELHDWFFTAGANVGDFIKSPMTNEIEAYDKFIINCLSMGLDSAFKNIKSEVTDSMKDAREKFYTVGTKIKYGKDVLVVTKTDAEHIYLKHPDGKVYAYDPYDLSENLKMSPQWSYVDSVEDEISGAYKGWYTKIGYSADNEDALRRYRVEIMRDRDLSYVEADELLKRIDRFLPKKDSVDDASEEYDMILRKINKAKGDAALLEDVRRDVKASDLLTENEKNRLLVIIRSALSEVNDSTPYEESTKNLNKGLKTVEDAEKTYKIYVKNAFGAYKVADWPAESKEKAVEEFLELNPRYKKIGIVEARDSVSNSSERTDNSLKTFKVQYTKDSKTHIHLVKAKTVQDALKKVNDYRDLNDMTNAIIQCNKDMASAKDKAVEYLACKSLLEDIVNQADPKVKEHWRQEKDNWLKAMKAKYNV